MSIVSNPESELLRRDYLVLFSVALLVALAIVILQPVPGYMDAAYYYAGGTQLATGNGFQEQIIWNYLDHPQGLPHPSHAYWYPMASLMAAAGMLLTGVENFVSARIGFVLMAALAPLVIVALAYRMTRRRTLALLSGVLAIFSGYYLPFIVTTDNYSLYLLIGATWLLLLENLTLPRAVLLGLLAGILNLARGDGLLWLPMTSLAAMVLTWRQLRTAALRTRIRSVVLKVFLCLFGYLLVMGPWMLRNWSVFGSWLPPGSSYMLWMTNYNQIFSYTPEIYTFQSWIASGWQTLLMVRIDALLQNLGTAFFAQGMIILVPLVMMGAWSHRKLIRVQVGVLGWILLLVAQSVLFPFASVSGGFFHAGAAFQPLWFVLAPLGLEILVTRFSKCRKPHIARSFRLSLGIIAIVFSGMLVKMRVIDTGWNEGEYLYQAVDRYLVEQGVQPAEIVLTRNPPAYFNMTGRQAIVVPYGDIETLLAVSQNFGARFLLLERDGIPAPLLDLYEHPENYPEFSALGAVDDSRIFFIKPSP